MLNVKALMSALCMVSFVTTLVTPLSALSQPSGQSQQSGGQGDRPPMPPQEAFSACKSKKQGDACEFSVSGKTMSGTCWAPESKPIACKPEKAK
jgi:hypothetical protein